MKKESGFTLIEVIATLMLLGLIGLGTGMFLVRGVEGYFFARTNSETFQKVNLAVERLRREAEHLDTINAISAGSIRYERANQPFGIALVDDKLQMLKADAIPSSGQLGSTLIDRVESFSIALEDNDGDPWIPSGNHIQGLSIIAITLGVNVNGVSKTFTVRVNPLYNDMVNGPTA